MTEIRDSFLRKIAFDVENVDLRTEFADWLDSQGDPLGELLRSAFEENATLPSSNQHSVYNLFPGLSARFNCVFKRGFPVALHPAGLFHAQEEPRYFRFSSDQQLFELVLPRVRVFDDRLVVKSLAGGTTSKVIDHHYQHSMRFFASGGYRIIPRSAETGIEFTTRSSEGRIDYRGCIDGNQLEVTWRSSINGATGRETYDFIPFQNAELAAELPQHIMKEMMDELNGPTELEF